MSRIDDIINEAKRLKGKINLDIKEPLCITQALYEFCQQQDRPWSKNDKDFYKIESCLKSLEDGKPIQARSYYSQVPLGGMGCFNDWLPSQAYENPKSKYHGFKFNDLCRVWSITMMQIQA